MTDYDHSESKAFSVLSLADGFMNTNPAFRAEIEFELDSNAGTQRTYELFCSQNDALRSALNPVLLEPIPQRLFDVLENGETEQTRGYTFVKGMAAASVVIAALFAWMFAVNVPGNGNDLREMSRKILNEYYMFDEDIRSELNVPQISNISAPRTPEVLRWDLVHYTVSSDAPPDILNKHFFTKKEEFMLRGKTVYNLTYRDKSGSSLEYYVTVGADSGNAPARLLESENATAAYWSDGIVRSVVIGKLSGDEMARVAEYIRDYMPGSREAKDEGKPFTPAATPYQSEAANGLSPNKVN